MVQLVLVPVLFCTFPVLPARMDSASVNLALCDSNQNSAHGAWLTRDAVTRISCHESRFTSDSPLASRHRVLPFSNRNIPLLESGLNRCKETIEARSNRNISRVPQILCASKDPEPCKTRGIRYSQRLHKRVLSIHRHWPMIRSAQPLYRGASRAEFRNPPLAHSAPPKRITRRES